MRSRTGGFVSVLAMAPLLGIVTGCATVEETLAPVPTPPNLVGKWKGEWGGNMVHPIEVVVEDQQGQKVSGTMVFVVHGSFTYHRMRGSVGAKRDGSIWVLLDVGGRDFSLKVVSDKRLEGTGRSTGHYGPVSLSRQ